MSAKAKRIVVKLGTGILTQGVGEVDRGQIARICAQVAAARAQGYEIILVSSGAVGMGMGALNMKERPKTLAKQQACAAIGQSRLIQCWQDGLLPYGIIAGQMLLTHEGLRYRNRYVNAKATIEQLLAYGAIPIINENDSISSFEIRFGNNDLLGAMVSSLSEAEQLIILSTAPGLIDMEGSGQIIPVIEEITPEIEAMAKGTSSPTAVGGMVSKIQAVKVAVESGCATYIASGSEPDILLKILEGQRVGTRFQPNPDPKVSKKRWLAYFQGPEGSVTIDDGACRAIIERGRSLLAPGVAACSGLFEAGAVVDVINPAGLTIARGETQFSSVEINEILANHHRIEELHPDKTRLEVIHRDALVLL